MDLKTKYFQKTLSTGILSNPRPLFNSNMEKVSIVKWSQNCIFVAGSGDAEVELLPDDLRLYSVFFWYSLANYGYFLAIVWLILATLGKS